MTHPDGEGADPDDGELERVLHDDGPEAAVEASHALAGQNFVGTIGDALNVLFVKFISAFKLWRMGRSDR
jgi:hypothetical protein